MGLTLYEDLEAHRLKTEDLVVFSSFGVSMTWGSVLFRW